MTQGLKLDYEQESLFEFYLTRFGGPQKIRGEYTLKSVLDILAQHPELGKLPFREQILERVVKVYNPSSEQRTFMQGQLRSAGQLRSNLFQIEANLGYWKKLIPSEDSELFNRLLNLIADVKMRAILEKTNFDTVIVNSKALFNSLRHYRRWLQKQPDSQKYLERVNQAMVDLVHVAGFFNLSLVGRLRALDAIQQIDAYYKILDARDDLAMQLGYLGHFVELQEKLGVLAPTGVDPALVRKDQVTNEDGLIQKLSMYKNLARDGEFTLTALDSTRIRSLSLIEAPFRSCLGGSDCSSRTYFSKALDPNFYYFTMTDSHGYSSGHVTVVLGTARDYNMRERRVAFVDKIQNVPVERLPFLLEGVRRSLAEREYELVLPKEVGDHNGLSNIDDTRSFVRSVLLASYDEVLSDFVPHPNQYKFENKYSRAYERLSTMVVKPLELDGNVSLKPGAFYLSREAPQELSINTLLEPILRLGESLQDVDILQFIALSPSVESLKQYGLNVDQYWGRVEEIFKKTTNDGIKKQALYALVLRQQRDELLVDNNFTQELWQQLLGEIPQWANSSHEDRKKAWARISQFNLRMLERPIDEVAAQLRNPWINVNIKDKDDNTALILMSKQGRRDIVELLLKVPGIDVNAQSNYGNTALMWASEKGYRDVVELLLKVPGMGANAKDHRDASLLLASEKGYRDVVELLLKMPDVDVNAKGQGRYAGKTALMWASEKGHRDIAELLLKVPGIDLNAQSRDGNTALMWASEKGHRDIVELLLKVPGIDVNAHNRDGDTALMLASSEGHRDVVEFLLKVPSIDVNAKNDLYKRTALISTIQQGHPDVAELLLKMPGIDVNAQGRDGHTALVWASINEYRDVVELLLKMPGIDVNTKKDSGSALMWASKNGHRDVVELLLKMPGIDVNAQGYNGTALVLASEKGYRDVVELLLKMPGIDVNGKEKSRPALVLASMNGHRDVVELLLKMPGIDVNAKNKNGYTALVLASMNGHRDVVELLLKMPGIDVNTQNQVSLGSSTYTALVAASDEGHRDIVELLLKIPGIDVNAQVQGTYIGDTALIMASRQGDRDVVELLLKMPGIDVNAQGYNGTALVLASEKGYRDIVELLLKMPDVDVNTKGQGRVFGKTALVLASENGHRDIVQLLQDHQKQ